MPIAREHEGKLLISIADGKKLGKIQDLYFDAEVTKVIAVSLGTEGLFERKSPGSIGRAAIRLYGIDAWLVSSSDSVVDASEIPGSSGAVLASNLRGRQIVSEGGSKIGTVADVLLDAEANVQGVALGNVYVSGPISERKTISREAFSSMGSEESPMTTLLEKAEVWERANS